MESQIKDLLSDDKLRETYLTNHANPENTNTNTVSDIISGKLYKELIEEQDFSHNDLSLTWNTDGIPIFESSKFFIWPIQSVINELPPHLREKNVLLNGLWFGNGKPAMNTFLIPFTEDCTQLEKRGFTFKDETSPKWFCTRVFCRFASKSYCPKFETV